MSTVRHPPIKQRAVSSASIPSGSGFAASHAWQANNKIPIDPMRLATATLLHRAIDRQREIDLAPQQIDGSV